jgi:hypothetical protein
MACHDGTTQPGKSQVTSSAQETGTRVPHVPAFCLGPGNKLRVVRVLVFGFATSS